MRECHDLNHQNKISEPHGTSCVPFLLISIEGGEKSENKNISALSEIVDSWCLQSYIAPEYFPLT